MLHVGGKVRRNGISESEESLGSRLCKEPCISEVAEGLGGTAYLSSTKNSDPKRTRGGKGRRERVKSRVDAIEECRRVNDSLAGLDVGRREVLRQTRRATGGEDEVACEAFGGSSRVDVARGDLEDVDVGSLAACDRLDSDNLLSKSDSTALTG